MMKTKITKQKINQRLRYLHEIVKNYRRIRIHLASTKQLPHRRCAHAD